MLEAISNLAFWNWSSLGKQNQIANCGLKCTSLCISLLISPRGLTFISAPFWYIPDVMPAITQVVMISSMFAVPTPSATSISYSTFMSWRNTKGTSRFLERRIASVCVFQAVSLFVILPMLIVIQLLCSDPGSFSPLTEKASVLWCKLFLWNCCKVL